MESIAAGAETNQQIANTIADAPIGKRKDLRIIIFLLAIENIGTNISALFVGVQEPRFKQKKVVFEHGFFGRNQLHDIGVL